MARRTLAATVAMAMAPIEAPAVLVARSMMLAVRTGEKTWRPSTVALTESPISVARRISSRMFPCGEVTTQRTPSPAKSVRFRSPSMASLHPSPGAKARVRRTEAAARSGEKFSSERVATRMMAT